MKKLVPSLFILLTLSVSVFGQELKKLNLTVKSKIAKQSSIYVEPIDNDKVLLVNYLKSSLEANGFKIVSERKDAVYVITVKYHHRSDTGCGGFVMKDLDGSIIDIKNNAETVATFSFTQGAFEGKCASDIMSALVKKLNEKTQ